MPTWSHEFEEGPLKLEEHELEAVDRQSRKTEIQRLMGMKVLKPISEEQATNRNFKGLSTKIVYDWRQRRTMEATRKTRGARIPLVDRLRPSSAAFANRSSVDSEAFVSFVCQLIITALEA